MQYVRLIPSQRLFAVTLTITAFIQVLLLIYILGFEVENIHRLIRENNLNPPQITKTLFNISNFFSTNCLIIPAAMSIVLLPVGVAFLSLSYWPAYRQRAITVLVVYNICPLLVTNILVTIGIEWPRWMV